MVVTAILFYLTFLLSDFEPEGSFELIPWTKQMPYILSFGILGIVLVSLFYKGKNGAKNKFLKYFFYVFYPLHLIIIHVVNVLASQGLL